MSPVPPDAFVNRELSWLEFNRRVLEEAQDPTVPLLERVKFLAIFSSNLDEFFMVRVAELKRRIRGGRQHAGPDGLTPSQTLAGGRRAASTRSVEEQHRCFLEELQPLLAAEGIRIVRPKEVTAEQERFLEDYFRGRSCRWSPRWRSIPGIRSRTSSTARCAWSCRSARPSRRSCRTPPWR